MGVMRLSTFERDKLLIIALQYMLRQLLITMPLMLKWPNMFAVIWLYDLINCG